MGLRQYTDARGSYRFTTVPIGRHALRARMLGYQSLATSVDVIAGQPSRHDIVLRRLPRVPTSAQALGKIDVTAKESASRFADFDRRRMRGGGGIFLSDSQIQTGGHVRLTDLFRRVPSIEVIDRSGIKLVTSRLMLKPVVEYGKDFNLVPCVFQVVVDDVPMPWGFDMDLLQHSEIHGIEVYSGPATIPVEYRSTRRDASCGMIAIWTRSR